MRLVYAAADPIEAEILREYLAAHGIVASVFGGIAWGARGQLPADIYPQLALHDERDETRARELLRQYEEHRHAHGQWACSCGESSPVTFESCWNCGAEKPKDPALSR
jgi:hypothetical protein